MREDISHDQLRALAVDMETLDIQIAAAVAYMCMDKLRKEAKAGNIPGAAKRGRSWVFIKAGLMAWISAGSPCKIKDIGGDQWQSGNVMDVGTLTSPLKEQEEYVRLLGLPTQKPTVRLLKSGMTNTNQISGIA